MLTGLVTGPHWIRQLFRWTTRLVRQQIGNLLSQLTQLLSVMSEFLSYSLIFNSWHSTFCVYILNSYTHFSIPLLELYSSPSAPFKLTVDTHYEHLNGRPWILYHHQQSCTYLLAIYFVLYQLAVHPLVQVLISFVHLTFWNWWLCSYFSWEILSLSSQNHHANVRVSKSPFVYY